MSHEIGIISLVSLHNYVNHDCSRSLTVWGVHVRCVTDPLEKLLERGYDGLRGFGMDMPRFS